MDIPTITSAANPAVRHARRLIAERRYRYEHGEYVVEGYRALEHAAARTLLVREGAALPAAEAARVLRVAAPVFDRLVPTGNSQGVLGILPLELKPVSALSPDGVYVLLDRLQDPGNMGTIIRTARALGARGVIVTPGCVDPFSPKVVRSAAGAVGKTDIVAVGGVEELSGFCIAAAAAGGQDIGTCAWPGSFILAVGNEANGLSDEVLAAAGMTVSVPMPGGMESLNAAVAAGIILYYAGRSGGPGRGGENEKDTHRRGDGTGGGCGACDG